MDSIVPLLASPLEADPRVLLLQTTLVLGAAGLLALSLRRASAALRHLVWSLALVGVLALPFLAEVVPWHLPALPTFEEALPAAPVAGPEEGAPEPAASFAPEARSAPAGPVARAAGGEAPAPWRGVDLRTVLALVWAAGAALVLGRLLVGSATVWWIARRGERVTDPAWIELIERIERRFDLLTRVRLIRSDWTEMPMTWGIVRPVVLLPRGADGWSEERRELILTHEAAHIHRRDVLMLAVGQVVCALHWFNPLAWIALRSLRAEAERCCDDWVLRAGARASTYADHLLQMVRTIGRARVPAAVALPMAQRSTFEGRLLAILEPGVQRSAVRRGQAVLVTAGIAGLIVLLAALRPASAAPAVQPEAPPAPPSVGVPAAPAPPAPPAAPAPGVERDGAAASAPGKAQERAEARLRSVTALTRALGDELPEVRLSAARALGSLEDPRSVAALSAALRNDPDAEVRKMAAWALGRIEDAAAVPALSQALASDRSVEVRETAVWALGQIEAPEGVDALLPLLRDGSAQVRRQAAWALGQIESGRAVARLGAALRDGDPGVRETAAWALGQIEDAAAVEALAGALGDASPAVRARAAWALGQIEPRSAPAALVRALRDESPAVRRSAARALAQIEDPAGRAALAEMLQDDDPELRRAAARALGGGPDPDPEPRPQPRPRPEP